MNEISEIVVILILMRKFYPLKIYCIKNMNFDNDFKKI